MRLSELKKLVAQIVAGGGGGGLVVGPWVEVDYTTPGFPFDPTDLVIGTFDVPVEVEVIYVPQVNTSGGFWIADEDGVGYDTNWDNFGDTSETKKLRAIVPTSKDITVRMLGSMQEASLQTVRYRQLG